ncbi:hypothetical protein B0H13DRAFT_50414 [Mycena leptocephala]|nr:hypothetical protein B0H13DRAFT_50414 [Mycena leptocephala]
MRRFSPGSTLGVAGGHIVSAILDKTIQCRGGSSFRGSVVNGVPWPDQTHTGRRTPHIYPVHAGICLMCHPKPSSSYFKRPRTPPLTKTQSACVERSSTSNANETLAREVRVEAAGFREAADASLCFRSSSSPAQRAAVLSMRCACAGRG